MILELILASSLKYAPEPKTDLICIENEDGTWKCDDGTEFNIYMKCSKLYNVKICEKLIEV